MFSEMLLVAWSGVALIWWLLAWYLVATADRGDEHRAENSPHHSMTVFKPLAPLGPDGTGDIAAGLESFVAQLEDDMEMLLGIHEADRAATLPLVERFRHDHPQARISVVYRSTPDAFPNPKIAWQSILAAHATGELWLWSDADIVAPADFLREALDEYEKGGAAMVTFPYVIRELPSSSALLDALFVNVEFYPGLLLLKKLGPVDFGLGAAMLFSRAHFDSRVDWRDLGRFLADDFILGQRLQPVRIGRTTLTTRAEAGGWKQAVLHQLRWNKTVWWNRPVGAATRIVILPVLGWLIFVLLAPTNVAAWAGLAIMMQIEVIFSWAICLRLGCRLKALNLLGLELWTLGRVVIWFACWLPWPVSWRGRLWWRPRWT